MILTAGGPALIDWRNAGDGPPDLDVALTALIMAEVTAGSYVDRQFIPAAREVLTAFLGRAGGDPLGQLDRAVAYRMADPNLSPDEKGRISRAATTVRTLVDPRPGRAS